MKSIFLWLCTVLCFTVGSAWPAQTANDQPKIKVIIVNNTQQPIEYAVCNVFATGELSTYYTPRLSICSYPKEIKGIKQLDRGKTARYTLDKKVKSRGLFYTRFFFSADVGRLATIIGSPYTRTDDIAEEAARKKEELIVSELLPQHLGTLCTKNEVIFTVNADAYDPKKLRVDVKDNSDCSLSKATQSAKKVLRSAKEKAKGVWKKAKNKLGISPQEVPVDPE